jgi:hypothetical protein
MAALASEADLDGSGNYVGFGPEADFVDVNDTPAVVRLMAQFGEEFVKEAMKARHS